MFSRLVWTVGTDAVCSGVRESGWPGRRSHRTDECTDRVTSNLERTGRRALNWARRDKGLQRARLRAWLLATGVDLEQADAWGQRLRREGRGRVTGPYVASGDHGMYPCGGAGAGERQESWRMPAPDLQGGEDRPGIWVSMTPSPALHGRPSPGRQGRWTGHRAVQAVPPSPPVGLLRLSVTDRGCADIPVIALGHFVLAALPPLAGCDSARCSRAPAR